MNNKLKSIIAVLVVAVIVSAFAIPALAGMNALTSTAGWEASDRPTYRYAWATLSYSGGNGNTVICSAYATTNLGYMSIINTMSTALSATFKGNDQPYGLSIPFVVSYSGDAVYQ